MLTTQRDSLQRRQWQQKVQVLTWLGIVLRMRAMNQCDLLWLEPCDLTMNGKDVSVRRISLIFVYIFFSPVRANVWLCEAM